MLEVAIRTGMDLVFAILEKEENARIRLRMLKTALMAMQSLPPLAFFRDADDLRDEVRVEG